MPKERSANWDSVEKEFLLETISSRIEIIETKASDGESTRKKDAAWEEVQKEFEEKFGPREKKRLKEQYQRIKLKAKLEWRNYKKLLKKSSVGSVGSVGGGPAPKQPGSLSKRILNILPDGFVKTRNILDEDNIEK